MLKAARMYLEVGVGSLLWAAVAYLRERSMRQRFYDKCCPDKPSTSLRVQPPAYPLHVCNVLVQVSVAGSNKQSLGNSFLFINMINGPRQSP